MVTAKTNGFLLPRITKPQTVFDETQLYFGRPVYLEWHDEDGDAVKGNFLINGCDWESIELKDVKGNTRSVFLWQLQQDDIVITLLGPDVEVELPEGVDLRGTAAETDL